VIVVVGSRHDRVAAALVRAWPGAALCSAEDLTSPGWRWELPVGPVANTWVVDGEAVPDDDVSGVFVRRSAVYPEELTATHPEDRSYLAAETHAFLVFVLATTSGAVVNPVGDGSLGDEAIRPERWMPAAHGCGLTPAPVRMSNRARPRKLRTRTLEVVGDESFGDVPERLHRAARALAATLDLAWATFVFDGRSRLVTITATSAPSDEATNALGRLLGRDAA
jgi:hypothetical protein